MKKFDLEERLIDFAVLIIDILNDIKTNKAGNHLAGQIERSGTSPALNYGEAQSAESTKDFLHKMKVCLKELRETFVCLKIIKKSDVYESKQKIDLAKTEKKALI